MKKLRRFGLGASVIVAGLWLGLAALAQDSEQGPPPPPPAAEEADEPATPVMEDAEESATAKTTEETSDRPRRHIYRQPIVRFGQNAELKKGTSAESVIVIGGDAIVDGEVQNAVVAVGGNVRIMGNAKADTALAVLGDIRVEKGAKIHGEVVSVGGKADIDEGATVNGQVQDIDFSGILPRVEWLQGCLKNCVFMLRPLSFKVGWVWGLAGIVFLFYALIALIFGRPIRTCVEEINRRPATTFLLSILTLILLPVMVVILAATGVGVLIIPFLLAALFIGAVIGKIAILEWLGFNVGRPFESPVFASPLLALLIGSALVCLIYVVPVLGLVAWMVFSVWGLGVGVAAAFGGMKREMPPQAVPPPPPAYRPPQGPYPGAAPSGTSGTGTTEGQVLACSLAGEAQADSSSSSTANAVPPPFGAASSQPMPPLMPEALMLPRARFWDRMGAGFLDIVLVSILGSIVGGTPWAFVVAVAYFSGMWCWRSTTIGGIVLGLKVVRQDGGPVSFSVALVRALAGGFSIIVLFLGFLNIAWDKEKQGWHDKIAGTLVLKQPRGTPLLML